MIKHYLPDFEIQSLLEMTNTPYAFRDVQPASLDLTLNLQHDIILNVGQMVCVDCIEKIPSMIPIEWGMVKSEIESKSTPARLDLLVTAKRFPNGKISLFLMARSFPIKISAQSRLAQIKFYINQKPSLNCEYNEKLYIDKSSVFAHKSKKRLNHKYVDYDYCYGSEESRFYFEKLKEPENDKYLFKAGEFYLMKTKPINVPSNKCGQIEKLNQTIFDGQIHTAGFVDPCFNGSIVLEIRALSDQLFDFSSPIGVIEYSPMRNVPKEPYNKKRNNYQNQNLSLARQFLD